ncbi:DNA-processing protein DprA [Streptomyces noursei]|uniref:DNA-processing protein DprA n=1 Tax=Streptomyces noursei TaxID=1971 RepID=UPI0019662435|nr:DNA-processing protein DprA [Streptomyces noursei]
MSIAITGTRSTGHHEITWYTDLFARYLGPFASEDAHFHIGGAKGIDSLSLLWLAGHARSTITIVVPGTVDQQPDEAQEAISRCKDRIAEVVELRASELRTPAYYARNRYMVDRSEMVIGFPLDGSDSTSGTWQTIEHAATSRKPRLIVPV